MGYLFAASFVLWAITFAYVFSIHARQCQASRDLEQLRQASEQQREDATPPA